MKKYIYSCLLLFAVVLAKAQTTVQPVPSTNPNAIRILHSDFIDKNQLEIPGAIIFTGNVQVQHNGVLINCNKAYHYTDEDYIKAFGNVQLNQGDTIVMNSRYAEYDGKTLQAFATGNVNLRSPDSNLTTDTIHFNRKTQEAYYTSWGTIINKENTLRSKSGRYYLNSKKYSFKTAVTVVNPQVTIKTNNLDFYDNSGHAYVYGPSTITSKENVINTTKGFYDTKNDVGKLLNKSNIVYNNRKVEGDIINYDRKKNFAKATNNVKITDTINNMIATGHYAEVFRNIGGTKKDSMFITKKALVKTLVEKDTMFLHGKKILVTGPQEDRTIRAFNNVRFFKTDMSGKCDSIHSNNKTQLTKLIGRPVIWNNDNQMTGDEIHLVGNNKTEKLDSLKILNNAFLIQKDTIGEDNFNQVKGQFLYGKFRDNKLYEVDLIKNTEKIYFMYNDDNELVGIDKGASSSINMQLEDNKIIELTSFNKTESDTYPDEDFPKNSRRFRGFVWRIEEKITSLENIFPEEEKAIDDKIKIETKKKEKEEKKPMEVMKETTDYGKKEGKKEPSKKNQVKRAK
ncbi:OstA-like protein [Flavobacterium difficile]|uniref:OstA-like protein n=1 Tax=Flavobacterium difficile TaxID=2709659 RepID=A0ABX0I2G1_9FLAO|nr:OstA-like protein [Flavobacterium difficile]NHM01357.1 OstA-like protein [Flavobacterium difficile]